MRVGFVGWVYWVVGQGGGGWQGAGHLSFTGFVDALKRVLLHVQFAYMHPNNSDWATWVSAYSRCF